MKIIINPAGNARVEGNTVDLCASCRYSFEDCPAPLWDVLFGDGGQENICCCIRYIPVRTREEVDEP